MKKFKSFVKEEVNVAPHVMSGTIDIHDEASRDNINTMLHGITGRCFLTPYIALERVNKVLANYGIHLQKSPFLEGDHGVEVFDVHQFGHVAGMRDDGQVVTRVDTPFNLFFEYRMNDKGLYHIFAEIVTDDELESLIDNVEKDINDESVDDDRSQKMDKQLYEEKDEEKEKPEYKNVFRELVAKHKEKAKEKEVAKVDESSEERATKFSQGADKVVMEKKRKKLEEALINEERAESKRIVDAWLAGKPAKAKRTHTDGKALYLHGNKIAHRDEEGNFHLTMAGWATPTTKDRLNTITRRIGGERFSTNRGKHYYGPKEISSRETVTISHGKTVEEEKDPTGKLISGAYKSASKKGPDDPSVKKKLKAALKSEKDKLDKGKKLDEDAAKAPGSDPIGSLIKNLQGQDREKAAIRRQMDPIKFPATEGGRLTNRMYQSYKNEPLKTTSQRDKAAEDIYKQKQQKDPIGDLIKKTVPAEPPKKIEPKGPAQIAMKEDKDYSEEIKLLHLKKLEDLKDSLAKLKGHKEPEGVTLAGPETGPKKTPGSNQPAELCPTDVDVKKKP